MATLLLDLTSDQALDYIKNNVTEIRVTSGTPADYAAAVTNTLAVKTGIVPGDFTGPADGDVSGRKLTTVAHNGIPVSATGTATSVCLCSATTLIWRVDLTANQGLTSGNTVSIGTFKHEIADAT